MVRFVSSRIWPLHHTFKKSLVSETIRSNCKTPKELYLALCRAQVSVLFPEVRSRLLHSAFKEALCSELLLSALSLRNCFGAIQIRIQLPIRLHHPINVVDLPGKFIHASILLIDSLEPSLSGVDGLNYHPLTKYYLLDKRRAILCFRVSGEDAL